MRVPPPAVRRLVSVPLMLLLTFTVFTATPVLVLLTAAASPWLPGRWRPLRLTGFLLVYLCLEAAGLLLAFGLWVASGFGARMGTPRFQRANYALLRRLLAVLFWAAAKLFRLRFDVQAPDLASYDDGPGADRQPLLVFCRHAGPGDSFLLIHALLSHYGRRPRVVLKDTLALDPLIDVLLHRLPSQFIEPNPTAGASVRTAVGELAATMGPDDALVIFPEGGNFTARRRSRAIERLRRLGLRKHAATAERMRHVLPPRPGGVLAAISAAPGADVVFVAHTGLDELDSVGDIWRTLPMDERIHAGWWRERGENVPRDPAAQADWLYRWWTELDDWIAAHKARDQQQPAGQQGSAPLPQPGGEGG